MPVVLVATLDTKGRELGFVRDILHQAGQETLVIDAGSLGSPAIEPDIDREQVFFRAGTSSDELRAKGDRGQAVAAAAKGVAAIVMDLYASGRVEGILSIGGSAGTTIGTAAMRALPFGLPKLMVTTLASGQTRPYLGGSDILLMPSVADVAGLNRITKTVFTNAANAILGMVRRDRSVVALDEDLPVVAATMFGVTTPCVERARKGLEALGCEVQIFHATGVGGQAMEGLIRDGQVAGVLDITTTELADELVGGALSAGPDRLQAAARKGVPQVVSVGALDMVNFGPRETVPERFADRKFHIHNPNVTLMRTTTEECAAIGQRMAEVLKTAIGPTVVMIPSQGVSALDAPGQPFYDPEADRALFSAIERGLGDAANVRLIVRDQHVNDPSFADAAARELIAMMRKSDPRFREPSRT